MVNIRYINMCYVNDICRFTFPSTSLWWAPGSPSGWWRLRKAKRLLLGGQKVFKNCATKFPLGCNDFISLQQDCQQVAKKLRMLTLNTSSCYMVGIMLTINWAIIETSEDEMNQNWLNDLIDTNWQFTGLSWEQPLFWLLLPLGLGARPNHRFDFIFGTYFWYFDVVT